MEIHGLGTTQWWQGISAVNVTGSPGNVTGSPGNVTGSPDPWEPGEKPGRARDLGGYFLAFLVPSESGTKQPEVRNQPSNPDRFRCSRCGASSSPGHPPQIPGVTESFGCPETSLEVSSWTVSTAISSTLQRVTQRSADQGGGPQQLTSRNPLATGATCCQKREASDPPPVSSRRSTSCSRGSVFPLGLLI